MSVKKTALILFGASAALGVAYLGFAYTPVGKISLSKWLLKKWGQMAERKKKKIDKEYLAKELKKLNYSDHELLVKYTRFDPFKKESEGRMDEKAKARLKKLLGKMAKVKLFERADLRQLENIVLPG